MPVFQTTRLVVVVVAALTAGGCGTAFYYKSKQTRTYEFERRVQVVVRSDPTGATIMTSDGLVLGQAPLIVDERVRVRQNYHSSRVSVIVFGCILDLVSAAAIGHAADHFDSGSARWAANIVRYSLSLDSAYAYYISSTAHSDEQVISRTIDLMARHDGLTDARVQFEIPTTRAATLRFRRAYTFDEALVLWARDAALPPNAENLYGISNAYWNLARQGVHGAMKRALELFTLYMERYGTKEPVDNVGPAHRERERSHPGRHQQ